jgi:hypothetical protein
MAAPDPKSDEWFDEFRKLNTHGATPSGAPGGEASSANNDPPAPKGSERRRFGRFEVDLASTQLYKEGLLAFIGVGKGNLARTAIDVSEGGAQILVHERLAPGTKVRVKIAVEKYKEVIEAAGIVRWCYQSAKKKEDFFIGVQFQAMETAQGRKLSAMRDWFTSPQYKAVKQGRRRDKPPEIIFPK